MIFAGTHGIIQPHALTSLLRKKLQVPRRCLFPESKGLAEGIIFCLPGGFLGCLALPEPERPMGVGNQRSKDPSSAPASGLLSLRITSKKFCISYSGACTLSPAESWRSLGIRESPAKHEAERLVSGFGFMLCKFNSEATRVYLSYCGRGK